MRKIFIDVGAHIGETVEEVIKKKYSFDLIYCFEPVLGKCKNLISKFKYDERVIVYTYGLLDKDAILPVYSPGSDGASIFREKRKVNKKQALYCEFKDVDKFFTEELYDTDNIIMKINAEGSEVAIVNRLLDTGLYDWIDKLYIDFDIRKVKGKEHLKEETLEKLKRLGKTNFVTEDDIIRHGKTSAEVYSNKIQDWLLSGNKGA